MLEMPFCKLDTESSLMTTFWTPWGRKRWFKLPFGVLVAPEVYQRKQHELLAGLKGIEPITDKILVVGYGDTDKETKSNRDELLALHLGVKKLQSQVAEVQFDGHILRLSAWTFSVMDGRTTYYHYSNFWEIKLLPDLRQLSDVVRCSLHNMASQARSSQTMALNLRHNWLVSPLNGS